MTTSELFARIWASFEDGQMLKVCAWCGRVLIDESWLLPPAAALAAVDIRFAFSHSICAGCTESFMPIHGARPRPRVPPRAELTLSAAS